MEEISAFRRQLETHRPADWETLPDFPLYMDQVLSYMERQTIRLDESDALTASMVNNYTKNALVPRAEGKKYNRDHLAYLTFVCILKQVMSVSAADKATPENSFKPYQAYLFYGDYPLARSIYALLNDPRSALPWGFASFLASDRGQRIILKSGLVPATQQVRVVNIKDK